MTKRFQQQTHGGADHSHEHGQGADGDPLAELARLIGQTDPRSSFGRANAVAASPGIARAPSHELDTAESALASEAPPWVRTANVSRQQADEHAYRPQAAAPAWSSQFQHDDEPQLSPSPSFLAHARQQPEPTVDESRYDHVLYGQEQAQPYSQQPAYEQNDYAARVDDYEPYAPPMKKKRSNLVTVGAVVALGILGTASAFAYRTYGGAHRSGEPPVIKADAGAIKVVPPTSEGSAKPINDRFATAEPGKERLVPREEKPIDVTSGTAPRVVFPPLNQQPSAAAPPQTAAVRPNVAQANASVQPDEPRKVRTVSVRPDQPDTSPLQQRPATAAPAAAPPAPRVAAPAAPAPSANAPMSLSPQAANAPIRAVAAPAPGGGSYLIQIASQRTEADALASYRVAQSKFPSLLGSRNPLIRKADLGEKGMYYRALVGPFASAEEASQLCGSMRSAGGQCVIHRN